MKELKERLYEEALLEEQTENSHVKSKKRSRSPKRGNKSFNSCMLAVSAILLCFCIYFSLDTLSVGAEAAAESFATEKDKANEEAYQFFYDKSFEAAEKAHHVSNRVSISVGDLREEQKLEVLKVSEVTYEVPKPKDQNRFKATVEKVMGFFDAEAESWLEVPGNGVFVVNLRAGEFIIDEERQYVLIRVPSPELTSFTIDYENVELLTFEKGGIFKNNAKYGMDMAVEELQSAELTMRHDVNNNQKFYERAKDSAEKMLISLVKQLNPELPDLVVEVEFID